MKNLKPLPHHGCHLLINQPPGFRKSPSGAFNMAETELRDGKNVQMRKMVNEMTAAQKKEIAQFEKFLAKNGQPAGAMGK